MTSAFRLDGLSSSHPIKVNVNHPDEINEIFDSISYNKGASILRMLESILGRNVFTAGLTKYLQKHAYGNAETDDLWQALKKVLPISDRAGLIADAFNLARYKRSDVLNIYCGAQVQSCLDKANVYFKEWMKDPDNYPYGSGFFAFGRLISAVTSSFASDYQLNELIAFNEKHKDGGSGSRAMQQSVESVKANIKWLKENEKDVEVWLEKFLNDRSLL
ncbi:hypothetical protein QZH41_003548 [Actinostola sp. cb2023]|nr:hypothetical protein QZH41_003548 [Actinostola sp. cb2023]